MYNFVKSRPANDLVRETPVFAFSALIAELFYKFGSFSIELVAFLLTWYTLSRLLSLLMIKK